ncbi:MAG TPA: 50S ribosomal protein L3 [Lentisphaeria bacterium]|nr:MAG: 50S ribosomal protein L3 [Lentisphaerae bacterium GWF2_38_69]HBM15460.1 50S ribosomal protein L3 [Lentisphaeria bacterium]
MKGLIGKKVGMTQLYDETGKVTPVTVIQAGPCTVIDTMTDEGNGYSAVQVGYGEKKAKNVSKALKGHCKKAGKDSNPPEIIKEFRTEKDEKLELGTVLTVDQFKANEFVDISGVTKGKGFQGVVRRYKFAGGRASHGGGWVRRPGSSGNRTWPAKVDRNKRRPGHMGSDSRTVQNLQVMRIDKEDNLLFVKGAVPGGNGGVLLVRPAKKKTSA